MVNKDIFPFYRLLCLADYVFCYTKASRDLIVSLNIYATEAMLKLYQYIRMLILNFSSMRLNIVGFILRS